jgi:hypothetical protein
LRLILGVDAEKRVQHAEAARAAEADKWRHLTVSTVLQMGEISFSDVVSALAKIETKLGREVNPTVYGPREFREKFVAKNHFLSAVAREKKLFVIGDEREFRRLGQERLARRT